jgi:hypothetical protein
VLAVTLVGSHELLMMIVHGGRTPGAAPGPHNGGSVTNPLRERAVVVFAAELEADRILSVRAIRAPL